MDRGALWVVMVAGCLAGATSRAQAPTPSAPAQTVPASRQPAATPAPPKAPDGTPAKSTVVAAGRKAAEFCANCHGEDGNSKAPDVPNLAGQNRTYLAAQLQKFASGERRNKFKEGLIRLLPPQDLPLLATYYAESPVKLPATATGASVAPGRALYQRHCTSCHGADGHGNETTPRVAGQQPDYLRQSLMRYRSRSGERINEPMSAVTGALKDEDIAAVVAYLAGAR
ncbi:MAG: c-type cytochrome [Betaproteobacteria bacterium]